MINIYDLPTAKNTILDRRFSLEVEMTDGLKAGMKRIFGEVVSPQEAVRRILADIRNRGDDSLREWTQKIDGVQLENMAVPAELIEQAPQKIDGELYEALQHAAGRIRAFHEQQPLPNWTTSDGTLGQRVTPINRVGVYVPGGTAPLPSSLLMSVVPAQVAGVKEVVVATPPGRAGQGVPDVILAAAEIVGIKTIYTVGGAQAIGGLAFGTQSIPAVDKIVGAGNLFVTLAKREVYGLVGIDGLYGPTETVVVADDTGDPAWIAADLLAQAEHDVLATAILLTPSRALAERVQIEIGQQLERLSRPEIIIQALAGQGGIVITADMAEACRLASEFAAEHTCIASNKPQLYVDLIPNAGGLFIGERSFEVLGDYVAGPSHVMPTSGTARFASPLNVLDFVKITSMVALDDATSAALSPIAARIAQAEGLTAHAAAAKARIIEED
ncbi:MAG: histidinol dehydrogenase [Ardenticatenaceae bacterium]|nr:histidinol dehydrogenase [Ardenticatenaceae bacterium]